MIFKLDRNLEELGESGGFSIYLRKNGELLDYPEYNIDVDSITFSERMSRLTKMADFLSPVRLKRSEGLLITTKVLDVLKNFKICKYELHPVEIFKNGRPYSYYFMHFKEHHFLSIKEDSLVLRVDRILNPNEFPFHYNSRFLNDSYMVAYNRVVNKVYPSYEKVRGDEMPVVERLQMQKDFDYDLFNLSSLFITCFLSDRLVRALKEAGVTGPKFIEASEISIAQ